jgi:pimeloyl-ACP methyl ester carboxylesterase
MEQYIIKNHHGLFKEIILENFPDPDIAHENIWLPFLRDTLKVDENTILIGHSSGAVAAMRLAETTKLYGIILVSACHTDLGDENEKEAGYYSRPWLWSKMKENTQWILQFHGDNDNLIPLHEADYVASNLELQVGKEYFVIPKASHFFQPKYIQPIIDALIGKTTEPSI